jgi:hypothetical protein
MPVTHKKLQKNCHIHKYVFLRQFDIQANYNISNKIIIYFSTDNFLAFPRRIVWEGSQKAFKFTGGGIHVQELGLCSSIQIKISPD